MTRKWTARLLATGGLALALGCRSHPAVPVCTTPLLPDTAVARGPVTSPDPIAPAGAQLPKPQEIAPRPDHTGLPARPPIAEELPDPPPVVPPADVVVRAPGGTTPADVRAVPPPVIRPLLVEAPRPRPGEDGFAPGPRVPAGPPDPEVIPAHLRPAAAGPQLPLKPGETSGHAPDYRWLAGTLDRHLKGGYWMLRYADIGADDPWGGKVRLLDSDHVKDLRDGDVVYVEGELLAPASAAGSAAYPPFRATAVTVIEKAK